MSPADVGPMVAQVAEEIHLLVAAGRIDIDSRSIGQGGTAQVLLDTLGSLCKRSKNIFQAILERDDHPELLERDDESESLSPAPPERDDQSGPGTEVGISLFDTVIRQSPPETSMALLAALERASYLSPGILSGLDRFEAVGSALRAANPPPAYWIRFRALAAQAGVTV